jgi:hypothetical protein
MSTSWSLYLVPDHWTLKDCMTIGYMTYCKLMARDDEFNAIPNCGSHEWDKLYLELLNQSSIYGYASDDCGEPEIMEYLPIIGRLYDFPKRAYELVPKLKRFAKKYEGKRYMCLN